ncbi:MAG: hypothetical protein KUG82_10865 [Pseudomonadales bacterium]|nr:hypothetical protein [Pseudomonadales bacterium]
MNHAIKNGLLYRICLISLSFLLLSACQKLDFGQSPQYSGEESQATSDLNNAHAYTVATSNVLAFIRKDLPSSLKVASGVITITLDTLPPTPVGTVIDTVIGTAAMEVDTPNDDFIFISTLRKFCDTSGEVTVTAAHNATTGLTTLILDYLTCVEDEITYSGGLLVTTVPSTESAPSAVAFEPKNLVVMRGEEHTSTFGKVEMRIEGGGLLGLPVFFKSDLIQEDIARSKTYLVENFLYENDLLTGTIFHSDWGYLDIINGSFSDDFDILLSENVVFQGQNNSELKYSITHKPNKNRLSWSYLIEVDADGDSIYESTETILGSVLFNLGG